MAIEKLAKFWSRKKFSVACPAFIARYWDFFTNFLFIIIISLGPPKVLIHSLDNLFVTQDESYDTF